MHRFRFLSASDYLNLKRLLEERVRIWMKNWTLSPDRNVEILKVSLDNFDIKSSKQLCRDDKNQSLAYYVDTALDWESLTFDSHYNDCPKDELLNQLMAKIRHSFFTDVFGFSQKKINNPALLKNCSFKDHILINLTISGVGAISFMTQESSLHSMLSAPTPKSADGILPRFDAIKDIKITAKVLTNFGEVSFLDLIRLKERNMINSTKAVTNEFELQINSRSICNVALGKVGNSKSIIVEGISK